MFRVWSDGKCRRQWAVWAFVLALTPFAAVSPGSAACVLTGTTVDCTGSSPPFSTGLSGLTVTVEPGASVTGAANNVNGLNLNANNTVTNNGTITVLNKSVGIFATNNNTVVNNGAITTGGNNSAGIQVKDNNTLNNSGPIQTGGNSQGLVARDGNTLTNTGAITTGGNNSVGIQIRDNNTLTTGGPIKTGGSSDGVAARDNNIITNTSSIVTGGNGSAGIAIGSFNTVTNATGSLIQVGNNSAGIDACACTVTNTITNAGTVIAGNNSAGIALGDKSTVTNTGSITVGQLGFGIFGGNRNTVTNGGFIATGQSGIGISVDSRNTVANAGSITTGDFGTGIEVNFRNTVTNNGLINVGFLGVGIGSSSFSPDRNRIINAGTIVAGIAGAGIAVHDDNRIRNNGAILLADGGIGIAVNDNNRIRNNGTINTGILGTGIGLGSDNRVVNNGVIKVGAQGLAIDSCGCTSGNRVTNNGTIDGQVGLFGTNQTFNNNGLLTITDPGTPIGIFAFFHQINGTFNQSATGTLELRVTSTNDTSDALAAQNLNLAGTLRAAIQPGLYGATTLQSNVVSSSVPNTITTTFSQFVATSPFFTVTPVYDTNDPTAYTSLSLILGRIPFGAVPGLTINEKAVGNGLEAAYSTSLTGDAATFYSTLLASPTVKVFDALSGEGVAGTQGTAFFAGGQFNTSLAGQASLFLQQSFVGAAGGGGAGYGAALNFAQPKKSKNPLADIGGDLEAARRWQPWVSLTGGTRTISGDAVVGSADVSQRSAGVAMGVGYTPNPDFLVGAAVGGSSSSFSVAARSTDGELEGGHIGAYGAARFQNYYVSGVVNYGRFDNTTTRTIAGLGPTEIAKGSFASDLLSARIEGGRRFDIGRFGVTPFAALQVAQLWQRGFAENSTTVAGAPGILGLTFAPVSVTSLPSFLGAMVDTRVTLRNGQVLTPFVKTSWMHEFSADRSVTASFITIPTAGFTVFGPSAATDAARVEAGLRLEMTPRAALYLAFDGEFSSVSSAYVGNGGFRLVW